MENYNNMKKIREIYGATQDEIAQVAGVNRSTVSQWETGASRATNSKLEKLSIFYGIGPECFYEIPDINDVRRDMLISSAKRDKELKEASEQKRSKAEEFAKMLETVSFNEARSRFMFSMKILLATADHGELDALKMAYDINQKMARRLQAIIKIREEEEKAKKENNEDTLFDLLDSFNVFVNPKLGQKAI
ncbi:helix-turn-helix domain-containing protein [Anaerocolumna aminovalerica]|uniref:helix-turn-helix domain-containing protein n=1 Tax=Anaerocolumna aminovalerica TaxID=1527 RepID=UPI001C0EE237|nr:helix-turn-helix domain-containing protein [Anaerocolumna aminovalerica]MBU5334744.1 helix-turn-helix domain-containing protein [Anaerocolumna aminovalerica]